MLRVGYPQTKISGASLDELEFGKNLIEGRSRKTAVRVDPSFFSLALSRIHILDANPPASFFLHVESSVDGGVVAAIASALGDQLGQLIAVRAVVGLVANVVCSSVAILYLLQFALGELLRGEGEKLGTGLGGKRRSVSLKCDGFVDITPEGRPVPIVNGGRAIRELV